MQVLTTGNSVIDKMGLGGLVLKLRKEKKMDYREIAKELCQHPEMVKNNQTISHTSVGTWLKKEIEEQQTVILETVIEEVRKNSQVLLGELSHMAASLSKDFRKLEKDAEKLEEKDDGLFPGMLSCQESKLRAERIAITNAVKPLVTDLVKLSGAVDEGKGAGVEINIGDTLKRARDRANEGTRAIDCTD